MRILVTGGAGFIGSHLVDELVQQKHRVHVIDNLSSGSRKNVHPRAAFSKMDIRNTRLFEIFPKFKPQIVYHLAAQKSLRFSRRFPLRDAMTNIIGSLRMIELSKKYHVKKFVFYSTAAVYDPYATPPNQEHDVLRPVTPYGVAKRTVEEYLQYSGLRFTTLRLSNVYGPRQDTHGEGGVVAIFFNTIEHQRSCSISNNGRQTRDFIFVKDVVDASVRALRTGDNHILNVSSSKELTINMLYEVISGITGFDRPPKRGQRVLEQYRSALSNKRAKKFLHWVPQTPLLDGLKYTHDWFHALHSSTKRH